MRKRKQLTYKITGLAYWINDNIVGNPWALIICILFVAVAYLSLGVQGYNKWNLSTGLFANDLESAYELITGTASVVAVVALHRSHTAHKKSIDELHTKIDSLIENQNEKPGKP
jgi:hypothetical protein